MAARLSATGAAGSLLRTARATRVSVAASLWAAASRAGLRLLSTAGAGRAARPIRAAGPSRLATILGLAARCRGFGGRRIGLTQRNPRHGHRKSRNGSEEKLG